LRAGGVEFSVVQTERPGHARVIAGEAYANGFSTVAAMGGDGTLSEVVDGVFSRHDGHIPADLAVAAIPSGTGNDFLGGSGMSTDWMDAVHALCARTVRNVDIMEVSDSAGFRRFAANSWGVGYDAYVTGKVSQRGTGKVGPLGYMVEALRGIAVFNPERAKIAMSGGDPEVCEQMWLFAITNSERFGGGMVVNPGARVDDGFLNYAILHGVPRSKLLGLVFLVRSGKHVDKPGVSLGVATQVILDVPQGFPCHVDGDTVHVTYPVTVKVLSGAMPFVVAAPGARR